MVASGSAQAERTGSRSGRTGFRSDVQGLRAVAVLLVLVYHAGISAVGGGYVGVDVFFVISGYLITSHIVREVGKHGRLDLVAFYSRRVRRILPAALVVLAASTAIAYLVVPPVDRDRLLQDATATALYVPNMLFGAQDTDYLASDEPSIFQHYWSLGVEEQFYLFWPILLATVLIALGRRRWAVVGVVGALAAASFVTCLVVMSYSESWAFFLLPTRAWEFAVGGLVAILLARGVRLPDRLAAPLAWFGLVGVVAAGFVLSDSTTFPGVATLLPVLGTAAVIAGGEAPHSPAWLLKRAPMQFIGAISYSLYLVHWPLVLIPQAASEAPLPPVAAPALSVLAVPVAYLCYRFVEEPFRRRPARARPGHRRTVAVGVAASVLLGLTSATSAAAVSRMPIDAGEDAPAYQAQPEPAGTPFVPANLVPDLRSARDDNPEIYDNGCVRHEGDVDGAGCQEGEDGAPTVTLFGDSHAANWHPALQQLARDGTIRLDVSAKGACSSVAPPDEDQQTRPCEQWRQNVVDRLAEDPPGVIVLANFASFHSEETGAEDRRQWWRDGLEHALEVLPQESRIVVMADNPHLPAVPASCLSRHVEEAERCAVTREDGLDRQTRAAERTFAAAHERVDRIDVTPYLCNEELCPVVLDDRLAYRDSHHLTRTFSESLEPVIRDKFERIVGNLEPPT